MGITIIKQDSKPGITADSVTEGEAVTEVVDNYITHKSEYDVLAFEMIARKKVVDTLRDELFEMADDTVGVESIYSATGTLGTVQLGARAKEVEEIDKEEVIKILGIDTVLKIAKIGVGDLRKYLTEDQLSKVLTEARTGTRKVKIIAR